MKREKYAKVVLAEQLHWIKVFAEDAESYADSESVQKWLIEVRDRAEKEELGALMDAEVDDEAR